MVVKMPQACLELAQSQDGVLTRRQALEGGMTSDAIDRQLRYGRWQSLHRGVYAVYTGEPTRQASLWAAVHRAGPGAALSHQTAAELHKLLDHRVPAIHVTIPAIRRADGMPGVVLHRSRRIAETVHPSLFPPRTRIDETVLDLVDQATVFDEAFNVVCAACQRRLTQVPQIVAAMARRTKLRWRQDLTKALGDVDAGTHSFLEYRFLHRVERPHCLPAASRQAKIVTGARTRHLDNLYQDYNLCVELDGLEAHPDDKRWQDQRRVNAITAQGLTVLRYGWTDIEHRPCETAAQISEVLRRLGWTGQVRACAPNCALLPAAQRSEWRPFRGCFSLRGYFSVL